MSRVHRYLHWAVRQADFFLPAGAWSANAWWKHGLPERIEKFRVYEMRDGDGRAYLSPDGYCNIDPHPIHPPATYEEVVRRLSNCAIAPPIHFHQVDGELVISFGILLEPATPPPWEPWETVSMTPVEP